MFTRNRAAPEPKVPPYVTNSWPRVKIYRSNISENSLPMVMESSLNFEVDVLGGETEEKPFCALWGKC